MAHCAYCGDVLTAKTFSLDHVRPRSGGGSNKRRNLVPACNVCNSIKGPRTFDQVRYRLVQKKIGWPMFSRVQLDWMRAHAELRWLMAEFDNAKLACEKK